VSRPLSDGSWDTGVPTIKATLTGSRASDHEIEIKRLYGCHGVLKRFFCRLLSCHKAHALLSSYSFAWRFIQLKA
jgi:hypothetical protein